MASKKLVLVPTATPSAVLPNSWRYYVYTRRDGCVYISRLEIDGAKSSLQRLAIRIRYRDEAAGQTANEERTFQTSVALDAALFQTGDRVGWTHCIQLPQASILDVAARIEVRTGETDWLYAYPAGTDALLVADEAPEDIPPVRTMGHKQYQLETRHEYPVGPGANAMSHIDAFHEVKATEPQTFFRAYAEVTNAHAKGENPPIDIPGTVSRFEPEDFDAEGFLRTSSAAGGSLIVRVTGDAELSATVSVSGAGSQAGLAENIADALNEHALFGAYFACEVDGDDVRIVPLLNYIGTLSVDAASTLAVTAEGLTVGEEALDISIGRKYVCMAVGAGGISAPSPMSYTTGPVPAARHIKIRGLAAVPDDANSINVCAAPDGTDGPFSIATSFTSASTEATDAHMDGGGEAEPQCDARDGETTVCVKKNGRDWFSLFIPHDEQRSDVNIAVGRIEENDRISADLKYEMVRAPTVDRPGRPIDVRLVLE